MPKNNITDIGFREFQMLTQFQGPVNLCRVEIVIDSSGEILKEFWANLVIPYSQIAKMFYSRLSSLGLADMYSISEGYMRIGMTIKDVARVAKRNLCPIILIGASELSMDNEFSLEPVEANDSSQMNHEKDTTADKLHK